VSSVTANPETHLIVVTYDDARTSVDKIVQILKTNDYPPEGEPKVVPNK
jgi:copper chaperone CopZ